MEYLKINRRLGAANKVKKELVVCNGRVASFQENVRNILWSELEIKRFENGTSIGFEVTLPKRLKEEFEIIRLSNKIDKRYDDIFDNIIWGQDDNKCDELVWNIQIESLNSNRIHISGKGIPFSLRNLGLGKKMYKIIINESGYITSENHESYGHSDLLWESLVKDPELCSFISKDKILTFFRKNIPMNFKDILEKNFSGLEKSGCLFDKSFCESHKMALAGSEIEKHCNQ